MFSRSASPHGRARGGRAPCPARSRVAASRLAGTSRKEPWRCLRPRGESVIVARPALGGVTILRCAPCGAPVVRPCAGSRP
eukprot:4887302-Alexandrium_andersonii.AAC.1